MKKIISLFIVFVVFSVGVVYAGVTDTGSYVSDQMNHTKEGIIQKYIEAAPTVNSYTAFKTKPVITGPNYSEGVLSDLAISDTLKQINFYRYLYGYSNNIGLSASKTAEKMSNNAKGAVLLSASDFSHTPIRPSDMSVDFFNKATLGTSINTDSIGGCIAAGTSLPDSVDNWINDNGIASVGHRLNIFNPNAYSVTFGYSEGDANSKTEKYGKYATLSTYMDGTRVNTDGKFFAWPPAGWAPIECVQPTTAFNGQSYWSFSNFNYSRSENISVTLTYNEKSYNANMIKNTDMNYIFTLPPELELQLIQYSRYKDGAVVYVNVYDQSGLSFSYPVKFFSINEVRSVKLSSENIELNVGKSMKIYPAISPSTVTNKNVTWSSSNNSVATVDSNGNITAKAPGTAVIKATASNGVYGTCNVRVNFEDVKKSDWFYNAVDYVYFNNIIKGYNNQFFGPNDNLTRGMLVTILYRMEGEKAVTGIPKFNDVKDSSKYYFKAVKWATDNKIVNGYLNGNFGPEDDITREQLAVMLNNYARYKGKDITKSDNLSRFSDAKSVSDYAISAMKWAVGSGVITGNTNGTLNPQGNATRAEAAAMLEKYCKRVGR